MLFILLMYLNYELRLLSFLIIVLPCLILQFECSSQMESRLFGYPGFQRYRVRIVIPSAAPYPPTLTNTITLISSSSSPIHVVAALNQISWTGMGKFSYEWNSIGNTGFEIIIDSYPTTNTSYHRLALFEVNVGIFLQNNYTYSMVDYEFVQLNPTSILVDQIIPITGHEFSRYSTTIAYEEFYIQNTYLNSATAMPTNSQTSTTYASNSLTLSTLASSGYNIRRVKFRLFNLTLTLASKLDSYYTLYTFYSRNLMTGTQINNNQAVCPFGHFFGISLIFNIRSVGATIYGLAYVNTQTNIQFQMFYFTHCYNRCPLNQPFKADLTCQSKCPINYYLMPEGPGNYYLCDTCTMPCSSCYGNGQNCTVCLAPYEVLSPYDPSSGLNRVCMCPKGQYGNPFPTCLFCNASIPYCVLCTNISYCIECDFSLVYVPLTNTCECPPRTSPIFKTITYMSNGTPVTVTKMFCISGIISQSCSDPIISSGVTTNLVVFGQTCRCQLGGNYINNRCV